MKFAATVAFAAVAAAYVSTADASLPHIHPSVHRTLREQATVNIFVTLKAGTANILNSVKESEFATRGQKIASLVQSLESNAASSQKEVASLLVKEASSEHFTRTKSFWITNEIYVENATIELVEKLAALQSIAEIREEEVIPVPTVEVSTDASTLAVDNSTVVEWGLDKINTKAVWATGNIGQNVVVGVMDTGARVSHVAIAGSYLNNGFSWYDPEAKRTAPYDNNGHGSHVTGTIAGDNGIGVAPGAKWMACKGCRTRDCFTSDLLECFQFFACPTDPSGTVKDCSKAPPLVSNSWGGGAGVTTYASAVAVWREAGIIPIFANGNSGTRCSSAGAPADFANTIGVGSTNANDVLASSSSKGPSVGGVIKPDVSAPGVSIRSSWNTGDTAFSTISGTSMATPHVSGVVALLLNAKPGLTYDQVKEALTKTTVQKVGSSGWTCGGTPDTVWPNNQYGHGRIDAQAAVAFVKTL